MDNPWLTTMPRPQWAADNSGAFDAMPSDPTLRRRLRRAMAVDSSQHDAMVHQPDGTLERWDRSLDEELPHAKLRAFLKSKGISADDIEHVCKILDGKALAKDIPPDLPLGGRPTPGGAITPLRDAAMDAAMRIGIDGAIPYVRSPITDDYSTEEMADFAKRFPGVARIKLS
jgi:hypothetical protein